MTVLRRDCLQRVLSSNGQGLGLYFGNPTAVRTAVMGLGLRRYDQNVDILDHIDGIWLQSSSFADER
jgi:hypothetical protein